MLCKEGQICLVAFILGITINLFGISYFGRFLIDLISIEYLSDSNYKLFFIYLILLLLILRIAFTKSEDFQIAIRAAVLGFLFTCGIFIAIQYEAIYKPFGVYIAFLSLFHFSEYLGIAISHPASLSIDSFILNHSIQYATAASLSWVEFFIEAYFYPKMKNIPYLLVFGIALCASGEILRKIAMITAKRSFHHVVQYERHEEHKLVTNGVYNFMRHPSYVGWFYWSLGTQIILVNPVCFLIYIISSWIFFNQRIYMEEITLLNFFGHDYVKYQERVSTGLPFIKGYSLE